MDTLASRTSTKLLRASLIVDLRLAASKMDVVEGRGFQAAMALKYCQGSARLAETVLGLGRQNIEVGLAKKRTGLICVGLQSAFSGAKRWEEKQAFSGIITATDCRISLSTSSNIKNIGTLYPVDGSIRTLTTQRTGI